MGLGWQHFWVRDYHVASQYAAGQKDCLFVPVLLRSFSLCFPFVPCISVCDCLSSDPSVVPLKPCVSSLC